MRAFRELYHAAEFVFNELGWLSSRPNDLRADLLAALNTIHKE